MTGALHTRSTWTLAGVVGAGWAAAMAAGWSFDVEVGGPLSGLVTALVVAFWGTFGAVDARGAATVRAVAVAGCGFLALLTAWWMLADRLPVGGPVLTLTAGVVAVAVAARLLTPELPAGPVVGLTAAWGVAWIGAYALTDATLAPVSHLLAVGTEIVLATAAGAAVLGRLARASTGEATAVVCARWGVAAVVAVTAGAAIALVLRAVLSGSGGLFVHLGIGTSVALGVTAALAVRRSLLRTQARVPGSADPARPGDPARPSGPT